MHYTVGKYLSAERYVHTVRHFATNGQSVGDLCAKHCWSDDLQSDYISLRIAA